MNVGLEQIKRGAKGRRKIGGKGNAQGGEAEVRAREAAINTNVDVTVIGLKIGAVNLKSYGYRWVKNEVADGQTSRA
jgi:hypothetical protein